LPHQNGELFCTRFGELRAEFFFKSRETVPDKIGPEKVPANKSAYFGKNRIRSGSTPERK
jgi:hypothetical protein